MKVFGMWVQNQPPAQEWLELRIGEVRAPLIGTTRDQRESTLRAPSFFCNRLVFVLLLEDLDSVSAKFK